MGDELNSVLTGLQQTLTTLSQPTNKMCTPNPVLLIPDGELEHLQGIITMLKEEICTLLSIVGNSSYTLATARSQKESIAYAAETQAMLDKWPKATGSQRARLER